MQWGGGGGVESSLMREKKVQVQVKALLFYPDETPLGFVGNCIECIRPYKSLYDCIEYVMQYMMKYTDTLAFTVEAKGSLSTMLMCLPSCSCLSQTDLCAMRAPC